MSPRARAMVVPGIAAALLAAAYGPCLLDIWGRWMQKESYFSHGPLVPVASAWLLWRERARLATLPIAPSRSGLLLVLGASLLHVASILQGFHYPQGVALVATIYGLTLTLGGPAIARSARVPIILLLFAIPLPDLAIADFAFRLKIVAARLATGAIELAGITVVRDGGTLHFASGAVSVDEACSGLRSMIALLAMAVIYAHLSGARARAALCIVLAIPIAVFANMVRILLLCALELRGMASDPDGFLHQAVGLSVYAVAMVLLQIVGAPPLSSDEAAPSAPQPARPLMKPRPALGILALLVLTATAAAAIPLSLSVASFPPTTRTRAIPAQVGAWRGVDTALEPRILRILGTEDVLFRRYAATDAQAAIDLYVVHSADSRKVAHAPDICFHGDGWIGLETGLAPLVIGAREIAADRLLLQRGSQVLLIYYWYRLDGHDEASYVWHEFHAVLRQFWRAPAEGSMLRISAEVGPGGVEEAEARVARFAREVAPGVIAALE